MGTISGGYTKIFIVIISSILYYRVLYCGWYFWLVPEIVLWLCSHTQNNCDDQLLLDILTEERREDRTVALMRYTE